MKSIETSGKTVEIAIEAGLKELNCDLSDVNIDVLDAGSPGLFGMFGRLAKVRLTVKEDSPELDIEMPVMTLGTAAPRRAQARASEKAERMDRPDRPEKAEKPVEKPKARPAAPAQEAQPDRAEDRPAQAPSSNKGRAEADKPASPRPPRQRAQRKGDPAPVSPQVDDLPPLDMDNMSEVCRAAYDFLSNLTRLMGVNVEIRMKETEGHLMVQMLGDTLGILIGRRGETLDALQYLTSLQVNKGRDEYIRVALDTEHYRAKREEALIKLAGRMAARARKTGHRVALEPMNPYERRVLHSALQNNPYVTTHSEGEEPYRRVIITLK